MDICSFLRRYVLTKFLRKFHQIVLVVFVGSILGGIPDVVSGVVGTLLFFAVYMNTYIYNDLLDYEEDRKGPVYTEKVLVFGQATPRDFLILLGNLSLVVTFAITLWDPPLGLFAVLAVLVNNIRTHIRSVVRRQLLLMLVELFNFEAFWQAFYGSPIPAIFTPLFLAYASMYAVSHGVYKFRSKGVLTKVFRTKEMRTLLFISAVSALLALPALVLSIFHFVILIAAAALYALPQYFFVSRISLNSTESLVRIMNRHYFWLALVSALLLVGTVAYIWAGAPLRYTVPFAQKLAPYYATTSYFDALQKEIVHSIFYGVHGLKERARGL